MAGLTTYIYGIELRIVGISERIKIFADIRAVAFRATRVPVVIRAGPVQGIVTLYVVLRVQVIPTLPALLHWTAIPGNRECLKPPSFQREKILLQGINPKHIAHRKTFGYAFRAFGRNPVLVIIF